MHFKGDFEGNLNKKKLSGKYNDSQIHFYLTAKKGDVVKKVAKKVDGCTRIISDPKKETPLKQAMFRKVVDIELKDKKKRNVAKVRINQVLGSSGL